MKVFVTATDTDAGKTFVTAGLTRILIGRGRCVQALKPVCCGRQPDAMNADVQTLLEAQGLPEEATGNVNLYDFPAYAAPDVAARAQGWTIDPVVLVNWCEQAARGAELTLIEGVGGLMVPLAPGFLVADWLAAMPDCRVLLVARARLGGINHALLTLEVLSALGRSPDWIIVNDADNAGKAMLDNVAQAILEHMGADTPILSLCHTDQTFYDRDEALTKLATLIEEKGLSCAC